MATNGDNNSVSEDADMRHEEAECDDGEKVVTMMDVLQEQQDFEDDANAVLGASDDKNCTYTKGYIKRQAIYACMTCCSEAKNDPTKRAGVCLACSLNCHENHELIELYTKRNFRCDCGNPKFNSHPCTYTPDKSDLNDDNIYNQNFSGLYCNCHRPYPDPESTVEDDEMIQCIICEDWLHASHLDAVVPGNDQYSEMVCKACMEKNEFLHDYSNLAVNVEIGDVDVISVNGTETKLNNGDLETDKLVNGTGDTIEEPKMDVDDAQFENTPETDESTENKAVEKSAEENENKSVTDETTENKELVEHTDINKSDATMESEKTADPSQLSPDADSKNESNTAITTESNENTSKATSEIQGSEDKDSTKPEESKETPSENAEASKTITETSAEPEITNESEITLSNLPESEKAGEESTSNDIENNEQIETTSETKSEVITESVKKDETDKLEDDDSKKEDTKTSNEEIETEQKNTDIEISETNKELSTENSEAENTNKTDNEENNIPSNEHSEVENNDSLSKVESNETPKYGNTCDESSEDSTEVPKETINTTEDTKNHKENKRKLSTDEALDDSNIKKPKINEESKCIRPKCVKRVHKGATFWPLNFRQKLCTCGECLSMYKDLSVLFLLDPEDTVIAYETLGKERVDGRATQYEKGLEALSSLDRVQQINALTEYNIMKDKLLDFLKSFKDRKEIVKEEDIKAFFAGMKPKREPDGVYFCR